MKRVLAVLLAAAGTAAGSAHAATPIPEGPNAADAPAFVGAPATQHPVFAKQPPRHPFMAPNERSNLHVDAFQTDTNTLPGPLGRDLQRVSTFQDADCGSVTFDSRGRIVTVCVGAAGPQLFMFDANTLDTLASYRLPPRQPGAGNIFQDFAGGGYFYLDNQDRAVVPTTTRHLQVVAETGETPGFALVRDFDLSGAVPLGDKIISALPDWSGRIWFASTGGVVGTVDLANGAVKPLDTHEKNGNSFAVDDDGGVYVVTDAALYRFEAAGDGTPQVVWRSTYANVGTIKPGQTQAGSGTTPTVMTAGPWVAITDNADPMDVVVFDRRTGKQVCSAPVFAQGASDTDQSLIAAGRALITENNYGYSGPSATEQGATTTAGLERVDVTKEGCVKRWHSDEIAPSVVPKMSLANGLVYTYTKPAGEGSDPWYLTALDFRTGATVYKARAGAGLGFNNNYAPVTFGPDGTAYVGVLGGLVALRDATPPAKVRQGRPRLALRIRYQRARRCSPRRHAVARLAGPDRKLVRRVTFRYARRVKLDRRAPFRVRFRVGSGRFGYEIRAVAVLHDGRRVKRARAARPCSRVRQ
ncbi:MAG: hypothetical protein QOG63_1464 [Thermoleophilaceae bacterium]|jgi:hypothetical protein|nr:hypothetical protein [Thermoleophilaceae bacterium]